MTVKVFCYDTETGTTELFSEYENERDYQDNGTVLNLTAQQFKRYKDEDLLGGGLVYYEVYC
jgi:hypothetical protein